MGKLIFSIRRNTTLSHKIRNGWASVFLLPVLALLALNGQAEPAPNAAPEYQIKSVYLYHLANFVTWPDNAFENTTSPFIICILGEDPFSPYLTLTMDNETVKGRKIQLVYIKKLPALLPDCHILFVGDSEGGNLASIFKKLENKPVLTISDITDFVIDGGMVKFYNRNNKVRIALSPERIKKVKLEPNANLLRVADIIKTDSADSAGNSDDNTP